MKSIVRQQFLDLFWHEFDFDLVAKFWRRLYGIAASQYGYTRIPRHALEIRLSGFSRSASESLGDELEQRAADSDLHNPVVTFPDLDTLVVSSEATSASPPAGLGFARRFNTFTIGQPRELKPPHEAAAPRHITRA